MKKCPFCAESIQDEAVKCRFCGEFLVKRERGKWYYKTYWLIIAFLCIGPFVLPLIWINPRFSKAKKTLISLIIIILTYFLGLILKDSVKSLSEYYKLIS